MFVTILSLLGVLPSLISAVEGLFAGFPGQGKVKKDIVTGAVQAAVDALKLAGVVRGDTSDVIRLAGLLIDDYVAVQNAAGLFTHSAAVDAR